MKQQTKYNAKKKEIKIRRKKERVHINAHIRLTLDLPIEEMPTARIAMSIV